jgi:glycosyltransferase involved in cell wall biosynthesis
MAKVLLFGIYDPQYSRNRVLIKGLTENGIEIIECRIDPTSRWKILKLIIKALKVKSSYDAVLVGFPGQEVMILAKAIFPKPIIFDAFTSHYGGYILDRQLYPTNSFKAHWYWWLDKVALSLADICLADTQAHIDFFSKNFKISPHVFIKIPVGTDSTVFKPLYLPKENNSFVVHFHGSYIPLQGVEYIVRAAKILEHEGIEFRLVGKGQTFTKVKALADSLSVTNLRFHEPVPYEILAEYINHSDVSLGIFGETQKANIVIPNKIFEAIACQCPVITSETQAIREIFKDGQDVILCAQADPADLARKIRWAKEHPLELAEIGQKALYLFKEHLTEKNITKPLADWLHH